MLRKTISEFVVPALAPDDAVSRAVGIMGQRRTDCVLIIDERRLVGIFTERDFMYRVAAEKRNPDTTLLRDVMTRDPETLHADDRIAYAINRMAVRGFRNVPIVDGRGGPISVLDIRHIIEHINDVFEGLTARNRAAEDDDEWTDIGGG